MKLIAAKPRLERARTAVALEPRGGRPTTLLTREQLKLLEAVLVPGSPAARHLGLPDEPFPDQKDEKSPKPDFDVTTAVLTAAAEKRQRKLERVRKEQLANQNRLSHLIELECERMAREDDQ